MSEQYMYLPFPRSGVTYNSEFYALQAATVAVKTQGKTVEVWKRIAIVEAEAKVSRD